MKIPANALILVADGQKALILRNTGDEKFPNLTSEWTTMERHPSTAAQGADRPGRVQFQGRRSSVAQTDWHDQGESTFAERAAAMLDNLVIDHHARYVVVVAPPRTLSVLRRSLSDNTSQKVMAELAHDLVNHTVADIEAYLGRARAVSQRAD